MFNAMTRISPLTHRGPLNLPLGPALDVRKMILNTVLSFLYENFMFS